MVSIWPPLWSPRCLMSKWKQARTIAFLGDKALATGRNRKELGDNARYLRQNGYKGAGPVGVSEVTGEYYRWFEKEGLQCRRADMDN
jgi:hypothetical protein